MRAGWVSRGQYLPRESFRHTQTRTREAAVHVRGGAAGWFVCEISTISFTPAIRSQDAIGCGYNLTGIQRIKMNGALWIPILPPPVVDARYQGLCLQCGRRIKGRSNLCSISCRLLRVHTGARRGMAQNLVEFSESVGQPIHQLDQLCGQCLRSFCGVSCPNHLVHPHPQGNHAAGPDIITIERLNGWLVIDQEQLPVEFGQDIHVMVGEDGRHMLPIKRLPAEHGDGHDGLVEPDWNLCARAGCNEMFNGNAVCCCMRCFHLL
ncbi:uncharacterized protein [Oryza sativa Japonica Group]|uniref:Uncharacterized protein n=4 Tax=Oryza sativa subsp. japonica TaxID=39947 RepID=A3C3C4_ORYSJ|nr:hypothetical protein OsJ_30997 [Oryza sativa Japonica Group]KAF2912904.1 hypothetical protein DAI22_10g048000 [Oryza sativa Japonica Group]